MPPQGATSTELILFKDVETSPHTEVSYTSLRDLLSANRHVCINVEDQAQEDLQSDERPAIKNRLVELAARAYLLPSRVQDSSTPGNQLFFSLQWTRFTWLRHRHNHSSLNLQSHVPCLPSGPIWIDITRAFRSLFKLRPQPALRL